MTLWFLIKKNVETGASRSESVFKFENRFDSQKKSDQTDGRESSKKSVKSETRNGKSTR